MNIKEAFYDWGGLNEWLFHAVNDWRGAVVDHVGWTGTQAGDHTLFPVYLALFAAFAIFSTRHADRLTPQRAAGLARRWLETLCVLGFAYLLDGTFLTWAKDWFNFPRPLLALPVASVHVVGPPEYVRGLPSGHASFAMLVAATIWPMLGRRGRLCAGVFVAWVGISRVSVGAHFPADVLAGWLTALALVLLVRIVVRRVLLPPAHGQGATPSVGSPAQGGQT